jgi:protein CpxP
MKISIPPKRILLPALVVLLACGLAMAQPGRGFRGPGPGHGEGPGFMLERLVDRLDLTVAQEDQIRDMVKSHREANRETHEAMVQARKALNDATTAPEPDEAALRQIASDVGVLQGDLAVARAQLWQQVRGVLTPEQAAELDALLERHRERMEERREDRAERGPRPGRRGPRGDRW